jgi:SAM-dependent methyltransferase
VNQGEGKEAMPERADDVRERHRENRAAWNEAAARYEQEIDEDVAFLRAGGKNLMAPELRFLDGLGSWCRRAIHLQCAGGRDTLSLWNQGAAEVVGVDISERMIACARAKSAALGAPAQWFCCDVLDTPAALDGTADLVYTGRGALCWIMDIAAWTRVAARLLRPGGGRLYVFEGHPLSWVWDLTASELKLDPDPRYGDYFSRTIAVDQGWPTTYIPESVVPPRELQARKHERQWTLGHILNALVDAGLRLERFEEHPEPFWDQFPNLPADVVRRVPNTFSLLMRKP